MAESTQMTIFGELINHNQDYGLPYKFKEPCNEIHQNIYPNLYRDGKRFDQSRKECSFTLVVLTGSTFNNHLLNFLFHSLPKEVMSCPLIGFEEPRFPYRWRSMEFIEYNLVKIGALVSQRKNHPKSNAVQEKDY